MKLPNSISFQTYFYDKNDVVSLPPAGKFSDLASESTDTIYVCLRGRSGAAAATATEEAARGREEEAIRAKVKETVKKWRESKLMLLPESGET